MIVKKSNYSWILIFAFILCMYAAFEVNAQTCDEGGHKFKVTLVHKAGEHTPGERVYTCEICGYSYSEEISPTGHVWSEWVVDKEPTLNLPGHRYRYCIKYSHKAHYQEEEIPPLADSTRKDILTGHKTVKNAKPGIGSGGIKNKSERGLSVPKGKKSANSPPFLIKKDTKTSDKMPPDSEENSVPSSEEYATKEDTDKMLFKDPVLAASDIERNNPPAFILSTLPGNINIIDVMASITAIGTAFWYVIVLEPLYNALKWIKKKKAQADRRIEKSQER